MTRPNSPFPLTDSEGNPWSQARPKPTLQPLRRREPVQPIKQDWMERWGLALAFLVGILIWTLAFGIMIHLASKYL